MQRKLVTVVAPDLHTQDGQPVLREVPWGAGKTVRDYLREVAIPSLVFRATRSGVGGKRLADTCKPGEILRVGRG